MQLSVVIPCFNGAKTIATQLEALAGQVSSYPWELIVADNGCTDGTRAVAERYRGRLAGLRIIDASARRSCAHARNAGAAAATGDALLFCDADDEVAPGWIEAMGRALERYDLVAGSNEYEKLNKPSLSPQPAAAERIGYHRYLPYAVGCNLGVKRALYQSLGGFDETLLRGEDMDFCWKAQLAGTELHSVSEAVVHYRYRPTIPEIYRQFRMYGEYDVVLYKRYRGLGMPTAQWSRALKDWAMLLRRLPNIARERKRVRWVRQFALRVGRVRGCIKYRVMAP